MPPRKLNRRKNVRKPRRKMNRRVRRGGFKSKTNTGEFASLSCRRTLVDTQTNRMYDANGLVSLSQFDRAVQVAKAYQHYRISGVKFIWKPFYDSFAGTLDGGRTKPFLYYMIDKAGSIPSTVTLEALKQMGARPHAYDEKPISVTWRPSVLEVNENAGLGFVASQYKVSPWLSTNATVTSPGVWNPSTVIHQGLKWYCEQGLGDTPIWTEIEVQFQFKKPLFPTLSTEPAHLLQFAKLDASPDGIEGGSDGITVPIASSNVGV